ncbi:hypothetical protein L3X38_033842 [Prunus dulcis]|uniref:Uncharacterized protein n=1 Tax=Prunus dulcis TaxID=3755 RepID=A0AAD4VI61_PRUDU|nr:hypothetical protein L3X38_033842 [Prunus dulcis]
MMWGRTHHEVKSKEGQPQEERSHATQRKASNNTGARSRARALPQTKVVSEVPEDCEQEPEVSHRATPVPTVQSDVLMTKSFAEFLQAREHGVA